MNEQMINTVNERITLMIQDKNIQKKILSFENKEEAHEWIIKAAIATLIVKE